MRRRGITLLFAALGLGAVFYLSPGVPRDQTVEIVLGDRAAKVRALELHYASASAAPTETLDGDWTREASFRYGQGVSPPRVVHHELRLPDGDYVVAIDLFVGIGDATEKTTLVRNVRLDAGGSTSIDVAEAIAR